jgi:hypothetical protein
MNPTELNLKDLDKAIITAIKEAAWSWVAEGFSASGVVIA